MLDGKILDRARRLIECRFAERGKILPEEVSRILRKFQIAGIARSSPEVKAVRDACEEEIRTKAKIVWDSIQEVHKALGSPITETLRTDLKEEASRHIENAVREASELMERRLSFMKLNPHHLTLENTKREVNKKIGVKVDLYVDSLLCKPAGTGQTQQALIPSEIDLIEQIANELKKLASIENCPKSAEVFNQWKIKLGDIINVDSFWKLADWLRYSDPPLDDGTVWKEAEQLWVRANNITTEQADNYKLLGCVDELRGFVSDLAGLLLRRAEIAKQRLKPEKSTETGKEKGQDIEANQNNHQSEIPYEISLTEEIADKLERWAEERKTGFQNKFEEERQNEDRYKTIGEFLKEQDTFSSIEELSPIATYFALPDLSDEFTFVVKSFQFNENFTPATMLVEIQNELYHKNIEITKLAFEVSEHLDSYEPESFEYKTLLLQVRTFFAVTIPDIAERIRKIAKMTRKKIADSNQTLPIGKKPESNQQVTQAATEPNIKPKAETWSQVSIDVLDDDTVRYKIADKQWKRANYAELGFANKLNGLPNQLWPIFRDMAKHSSDGYITMRTPKNISKDKQRICKALREFFGPSEIPIQYERKTKRYVLKFSLSYKSNA
jgi:hypothetical protein